MKVTLYMAMSLDGYIAKKDDSAPWSDAVWTAYQEFVSGKGNIILGRRTYEIMARADGEFAKIGNPYTVVLSDSRTASSDGKTRFVKAPQEAVAAIRGQGFSEAVLGGGATVNGSFLDEGLIDEVVLDIEPIILGDGFRLFGTSQKEARLKLLEGKKIAPQLLRVQYRVIK